MAKYVTKLSIAIAPFLLVPLVLEMVGTHPSLARLGKTSQDVQRSLIGILTVADVGVLAMHEWFTHLLPRRQRKKAFEAFFEMLIKQFEVKAKEHDLAIGEDIRINVMFVRRSLLTLYFGRRFIWCANRGFDGSHRDNRLFLMAWQGLCGQAFRERKTLSVDLRNQPNGAVGFLPSKATFGLYGPQVSKTRHLKAILTIPIFAEFKDGAMSDLQPVGVINIDAISDVGAERLLANEKRLDTFFKENGRILAIFAPG